jgi:hypothetical protein
MDDKELTIINFHLADCSLKEARKRFPTDVNFYVVDISKIIKDLGYNVTDLLPESEFIINYSIQKKIRQGIYSTRSNEILITYKNLTGSFRDNLMCYLEDFNEGNYKFKINWSD